jgi:hypothetical protein
MINITHSKQKEKKKVEKLIKQNLLLIRILVIDFVKKKSLLQHSPISDMRCIEDQKIYLE